MCVYELDKIIRFRNFLCPDACLNLSFAFFIFAGELQLMDRSNISKIIMSNQISSEMAVKIYGIKNCNTMKKTFTLFDTMEEGYEFNDYKNKSLIRHFWKVLLISLA